MNTKQQTPMIIALLLCWVLSSCASGPLFRPTGTPTPAPTLVPIATMMASSTATATISPTSTPSSPPPELAALHWQKLDSNNNFESILVDALAINPQNPDILYAGTYGAGIYVSMDGGKTWNPSNAGLGKGTVNSIVIDPSHPKIIYAGLFDQGGMYKSTDAGKTWAAINNGIDIDRAGNWTGLVYMDPSNSQHLYFSDADGGGWLYVTVDGGENWIRTSFENDCPQISDLAIDPANGQHLYASAADQPDNTGCMGVYESKNSGQSWVRLNTPDLPNPPGGDNWHLAVDPNDFKIIYAGGYTKTFKSVDGGQTWVKILDDGCLRIYVHPTDGTIFCGQGKRVQISHDQGVSWSQTDLGYYKNKGNGQETYAFAAVPGTETIYAGTDQVLRSDNGGRSWTKLGGLGASRTRIVIDPTNDKLLFLTAMEGSWSDYRSTDAGSTWSKSSLNNVEGGLMTFDPVHKLIYRPSASRQGISEAGNEGLFRSSNNGISWQPFGRGDNTINEPWQLLPDPNDPSKLWLIDECNAGLAVSQDDGAHFSLMPNFPWKNLCVPILLEDNRGQNIYVVSMDTGSGSFFASFDSGNHWNASKSNDLNGYFNSAVLDPANPAIVYLGSTYQGILKTTDAGKSWNVINSNMAGRSITELAINPKNPQTVYAATDSGLYMTLNGGDWWWPVVQGLGPNPIVYSVAIDPNDSSVVYAVTPDGVFQLMR